MKRYFSLLIFLASIGSPLIAADGPEGDHKRYCKRVSDIEKNITSTENIASKDAIDALKELFLSADGFCFIRALEAQDSDPRFYRTSALIHSQKAMIKLSEQQFFEVVSNCQDFFKTRFGFGLIYGWMLSRFEERSTPYYVGSFFSFKKLFDGMIKKVDDAGAKDAINLVYNQALVQIEKDRFAFFFDNIIIVEVAMESVSKDALDTGVPNPSGKFPDSSTSAIKTFISSKEQAEERTAPQLKQSSPLVPFVPRKIVPRYRHLLNLTQNQWAMTLFATGCTVVTAMIFPKQFRDFLTRPSLFFAGLWWHFGLGRRMR